MRRLVGGVACLALMIASACSSSSSGRGAPVEAPDSGSSWPEEAGPVANDAAGVPEAAISMGTGSVAVTSSLNAGDGGLETATAVTASFQTGPKPVDGSACQQVTMGACTWTTCPIADAGASSGPPDYASAGNITVTDGVSSIDVPPDNSEVTTPQGPVDTVGYQYTAPPGMTVTNGDTVAVSAAGATVPPFTTSVTVPGTLSVSAPLTSYSGIVTLSRSGGLGVTWTYGGDGPDGGAAPVVVDIEQGDPVQGNTSIVCTFPAESGAGQVPAEATSNLALAVVQVAEPSTTSISVNAINQVTVTPPGWTVQVLGVSPGLFSLYVDVNP
jgi:hypothetical protein